MPALDRAVALAQRQYLAVGEAQYLHLDVPGPLDVALEQDGRAAEESLSAGPGCLEPGLQLSRVAGGAHADAAAASRGLDHDRVADLAGSSQRRGHVGYRLAGAGCYRNAGLLHQVPGVDLVAHQLDRLGRRADPGQPGIDHAGGEAGVLGQEAVAGVNGRGAGRARGRQHRAGVQVARGGLRGPEEDGLVGLADERQVRVSLGVDGHRPDAHPARGGDHAPGDLATIGDKDGFKHARQPTAGTRPGALRPRRAPRQPTRRSRPGRIASAPALPPTGPGRSSRRPCHRRRSRPG